MYHLIFVVKIKIIMKVCIVGSGLSSLALANSLAKSGIYVDIFFLASKRHFATVKKIFNKKKLDVKIYIFSNQVDGI